MPLNIFILSIKLGHLKHMLPREWEPSERIKLSLSDTHYLNWQLQKLEFIKIKEKETFTIEISAYYPS
jgi:hypothetical protein